MYNDTHMLMPVGNAASIFRWLLIYSRNFGASLLTHHFPVCGGICYISFDSFSSGGGNKNFGKTQESDMIYKLLLITSSHPPFLSPTKDCI